MAAYQNPPKCPTLLSPPIEWEQSLVAGHPTHPVCIYLGAAALSHLITQMHRARMLSTAPPDYDWYNPRIRFARVPRSSLDLLGPFESISRQLAETAATRAGCALEDDGKSIFMPFHELQLDNIVAKFHDIEILSPDINVPALAQSSIRYCLPAKILVG